MQQLHKCVGHAILTINVDCNNYLTLTCELECVFTEHITWNVWAGKVIPIDSLQNHVGACERNTEVNQLVHVHFKFLSTKVRTGLWVAKLGL